MKVKKRCGCLSAKRLAVSLGLLWGTICGAIGGALIAWLHNFALE